MPVLIDGYNLLHVTGLFGRGPRGSLEASRNALLGFLAAALQPNERALTTVVFDAAEAPPGLPDRYSIHGIAVHYARDYESADDLLEVLIAAHHSPRKLTVVSSDHRVQRAAKKRRATAVDSHVWYHTAAERLKKGSKGVRELPEVKPDAPLTPGEVAAWVRFFGPIDVIEEPPSPALSPPPAIASPPKRRATKVAPTVKKAARAERPSSSQVRPPARIKKPATKRISKKRGKPKDLGFGDVSHPFPPGYGEDVTLD
jgi:predicted RNA-binding protein with PIN domain